MRSGAPQAADPLLTPALHGLLRAAAVLTGPPAGPHVSTGPASPSAIPPRPPLPPAGPKLLDKRFPQLV